MTTRNTPPAISDDIGREITALRDRLTALGRECSEIAVRLAALEQGRDTSAIARPAMAASGLTKDSPTTIKIDLFRSLFRGREDVFPRRWESSTTGKAGYAPACRSEWVRGVCGKPAVKCGNAPIRHSSPSPTMSCAAMSRAGCPGSPATSPSASTRCCPMRRVGSLPPTSTRPPGCTMWPRSATRPMRVGFRSPSSDRARATAPTPGSSSPSRYRQPTLDASERCSSPRR